MSTLTTLTKNLHSKNPPPNAMMPKLAQDSFVNDPAWWPLGPPHKQTYCLCFFLWWPLWGPCGTTFWPEFSSKHLGVTCNEQHKPSLSELASSREIDYIVKDPAWWPLGPPHKQTYCLCFFLRWPLWGPCGTHPTRSNQHK